MDIKKAQLKFIDKEYLTPNVILSRFEVDQDLDLRAGEFANILVKENTWRSYSFFDFKDREIKFLVDIKPGGPGSQFFENVSTGDHVEALMPMGGFLVKKTSKPKIFVATGVGIAPFYSMINEALKTHSSEVVHLLWGVRYDEDYYLEKIFGNLLDDDRLYVIPCITRTDGKHEGVNKARVTEVLPLLDIDPEDHELYICGNPQMVVEIIQIGKDLGIKEIFSEKY